MSMDEQNNRSKQHVIDRKIEHRYRGAIDSAFSVAENTNTNGAQIL